MEYSVSFDLSRDDDIQLYKDILCLFHIHSKPGPNEYPVVFRNPANRLKAKQWPYRVKVATFYMDDDGLLDIQKLRKLIETSMDPTVISIRDSEGNYIDQLYLPKAMDDDPYQRALVFRVDQDTFQEEIDNIWFKDSEETPLP